MSSLENKFSMDGPSGTACTPPYTTEWLQAANDVPWPLARSWVAIKTGGLVDGAEPAGNGVDVAVSKVLQRARELPPGARLRIQQGCERQSGRPHADGVDPLRQDLTPQCVSALLEHDAGTQDHEQPWHSINELLPLIYWAKDVPADTENQSTSDTYLCHRNNLPFGRQI